MLADKLGLAFADEAFLAGLIHDIGLMVMMQYDRNKLVEVLQQVAVDDDGVPSVNMLELEEHVFGATHEHFGAALCERWKFPNNFRYVTGFHHRPMELASDSRTMTCVIYVADRLVAELGDTFRLDLMSTEVSAEVAAVLNLSSDKLNELRAALPEHLKATENLLG
jgi:HD-like signal output (HDOD) protein